MTFFGERGIFLDSKGGGGSSETGLSAVERKGLHNLESMFLEPLRVFSGDLGIVHHAGEDTKLPWEEPKPVGSYTLTQVPRDMSLEKVGSLMATHLAQTTDLVLGCMDKDVAMPLYRWVKGGILSKSKPFTISVGGGPIQNVGDRRRALEHIADYLYEIRRLGGMDKLERVWIYGHNHRCGAVAYFLEEESLAAYLTRELGMKIENRSQEETKVMAALVRGGMYKWNDVATVNGRVQLRAGVVDTHRSNGKIDLIDIDLRGTTMNVEDLGYEVQLRDAALRKNI